MKSTEPNLSLATRARQLTALARASRDGLSESQSRGQVQTALNKLDQGLVSLRRTLDVYCKLKDIGVPVSDLGDLEQPAKKLQEQARLGRPTPQFLQVRSRDIDAACSLIDETNSNAWRIWTDQIIRDLPLALIPRLHFSHREVTKKRIATLRTLGDKKPNIADIIQFQQNLDRVRDEFGEVGEASVDSLLERFIDGRILLADLSDAELEMLRGDPSLVEQLFIYIGS